MYHVINNLLLGSNFALMVLEKFKHISNVSADGIVTMLLYRRIGDKIENGVTEYGISGSLFAEEMQYVCEYVKPTRIDVRINSIGGNVFDGYSIVSAILNSTVPVHTYIDGLAASMAGVIAVAGKKCYMADYGTLMLHNPSGGDGDAEVLNMIKNTLVTIFKNCRGLEAAMVDKLMEKETWYNAKQAKEAGFVDEVVSSNKKVNTNVTNLSDLVLIYNEVLTPKKMNKVNQLLKLQNEASDEAQAEAVEALQKENENLKTELENAKAAKKVIEDKLTEVETAKQAEKDAIAYTAVENAIKKGVIKAEEKEKMLTLAKTDITAFNSLVEVAGNKGIAVKVFDASKQGGGVQNERAAWSIRDWEKKDPSGLEKLYNENREEYNRMYNEYYKK